MPTRLVLQMPLVLAVSVAVGACQKPKATERSAPTRASASAEPSPSSLPATSASTAPQDIEPDTVTQASPMRHEPTDAGAPVAASALSKVDGSSLRERHIARLKSDRSPVTVLAGEDARDLGRRACEAAVPERPRDAPVFVKPNLCGFDGFKNTAKSGGDDGVQGRVTDVEFTRGVVQCLKARGHTRIIVGDGCGNSHQHWLKAVELSGYAAMTTEEQVPLVALDDDGVFDKQGDTPGKPLAISGIEKTRVPSLLMPKLLAEVLEHGLFISVPKIKAHRYSVVSVGIKGMQGTVMRSEATPAYNQKWRMHEELKDYLSDRKQKLPEDRAKYVASLELFAERMVDVLEISLPDVVLAEGVPAMSGDGFQNIRKVPGGIAIAGTNPVIVDRVAAEYLGLWNNAELAKQLGGHRTSPLIEIAARRYGVPLASPTLVGDGVEALKSPRPVFYKAIAPFGLPASAEPPTAHAKHVTAPPSVDGAIDAVWSQAKPVSWQTDYSAAVTDTKTSARFLWTESALFALFELSGAGLNVDTSFPVSRERPKLYEEDCVELFLAPDPAQRDRYYEIELGPFGHFFDLEVDRAHKTSRTEWSSGLEVKTSHSADAHTAIIEAKLSAPELLAGLVAGRKLPLGLFRMEGKGPRRYLAWRPARTAKPNFHAVEGFGILSVDF